jgi:hypothetical protein
MCFYRHAAVEQFTGCPWGPRPCSVPERLHKDGALHEPVVMIVLPGVRLAGVGMSLISSASLVISPNIPLIHSENAYRGASERYVPSYFKE